MKFRKWSQQNGAQVIRPGALRTDGSNEFAHYTMKVRVPRIIEETQALNPDYPASIHRGLEALRTAIANDAPIPMLDLPAPDYDDWAAIYAQHQGETWLNTEWFFGEIYMYRVLLQAVRWWETGRDPFRPKKLAELANPELWSFLDTLLEVSRGLPLAERLDSLIEYDLWGNRIDLSYALASSHGRSWHPDDLLADDSAPLIEHLVHVSRNGRGTVHIVADNVGTELAADCALIDGLLELVADRVIFHLKLHPTFVSDTTAPDMMTFLAAMEERGGDVKALSTRLHNALIDGRLKLAPDMFWNLPHWMWELPPRLVKTFDGAALVIVKGDANYRRLSGDALYQIDTPFAELVSFAPFPILALRTLKSDTVSGIRADLANELDGLDRNWRNVGRYGVIQFKK